MNDECIFCEIIQGDIPAVKVYETDDTLAFMDIGPLSEGHTLVIPKVHGCMLHELPDAVVGALLISIKKVAHAVIKANNTDHYNVLNNNGSFAGQVVKHVHFHIIPRVAGDKLLGNWPAGSYPEGRMQAVAQKITEALKEIDD